jgi:hypothetical protein
MTMNRRFLAAGAALVLAAVVALCVLLWTGGEEAADRGSPVDRGSPARRSSSEVADTASGKPRKIRGGPTAMPAGSAAIDVPIGETRIRDHRTGAQEPVEVPPPSRPPDGRRIAPQVTTNLSQQIRPLLRECTASLASGALTDKSRVEGEIVIAIKDRQATVTGASLQPRNIAEAALNDVKQCLTQRAVGLTADAGEERDVDGYTITVSMALP